MTKSVDIPRDVRTVLALRHFRLTALSVAYYAAIVYAVTSHEYFDNHDGIPFLSIVIFVSLFVVLPFFAFRMHRIVTERNYFGQVTDVRTEYRVRPTGTRTGLPAEYQLVIVRVKPHYGFSRRYNFINNRESYFGYYRKGDRVLHLHFSKALINLDNDDSFGVLCPVCGNLEFGHRHTCFFCGHTLVRAGKKISQL